MYLVNRIFMYQPVWPSKESVEQLKKVLEEEKNVKLTDEEAREAAYNYLNFFNMLLYLDRKKEE